MIHFPLGITGGEYICVRQMGEPVDLRDIALNGFEVADIDSRMRTQLLNDVQVCFDHFFPEK